MTRPNLLFILAFVTLTQKIWALDYGFRYDAKSGYCLNGQGKQGVNAGLQLIECADFSRIGISGIPLEGTRLLGLNISKVLDDVSDIQDMVDISGADGRGLKAINTAFVNGNFSHANLEKADFSGSSFYSRGSRETSFENANLRLTKFRDAKLLNVNLKGSDLRGADLLDISFQQCAWEGAIYDQYTKLPFSEATAETLGMSFSDSGSETPTDYSDILAPPEVPAIKDNRIFERSEFCNSIDECEKIFTPNLSYRHVLAEMNEAVWKLTIKHADGTLWTNNRTNLSLWRPNKSVYLSVANGISYCNLKHELNLPSANTFSTLSENGFSSLFPEVAENSYWSNTKRGSSIPEMYYFFEATSGAFFFDFATKKAAIVCTTKT